MQSVNDYEGVLDVLESDTTDWECSRDESTMSPCLRDEDVMDDLEGAAVPAASSGRCRRRVRRQRKVFRIVRRETGGTAQGMDTSAIKLDLSLLVDIALKGIYLKQ